jgi:hypothetical protein
LPVDNTTAMPHIRADLRLRIILIFILLGVYILFYINAPDEADGSAVLAVSSAIVQHGQFDMNAIGASDWLLLPRGKIGTFGTDGALYAKKGPIPSIALIPFVFVAKLIPVFSIRATAMLFNLIVTTLTALLLYTFIRWLNYHPRTAFALALIYGLATTALPYVKTLFGEPLIALLFLVAIMAIYRWHSEDTGNSRWRWLVLAGAGAALTIGINSIYVVFAPIFAAYVFLGTSIKRDSLKAFASQTISFGLPFIVVGLMLGAYNWIRFGNPLTSGYQFAAGEGFNYPLLYGLYGLIVSPYRGLFFYNPVLLLSIPSWWFLRRASSDSARLAWVTLALVIVQLLAFATWWSWYGGLVWGPRFLLPILPLMVLWLAPLVERSWNRRAWFVTIGVFIVISFIIQFIGAFYGYQPIESYLYRVAGSPIPMDRLGDLTLSPLIGTFVIATNHLIDPYVAWWTYAQNGVFFTGLALIIVGFVIAALSVRISQRLVWAITSVVIVIALALVVVQQQNDPRVEKVQALSDALQPPATTIVASQLFGDTLIDVKNGSRIITMNAPTTSDDERTQQVWSYAKQQGSRLWLVTWFGLAAPENWQERELWQSAYFVREASAAKHRAVLFDLSPSLNADQRSGYTFSPIRLDSYATRATVDGVYIVLQWSAATTPDQNYGWFVHLLDSDGAIIAQQDRQPQGGYVPTSTWKVGEVVTDRLFLPFPTGSIPQNWRLRIGFTDPNTGKPLPVTAPDGKLASESFVLLN